MTSSTFPILRTGLVLTPDGGVELNPSETIDLSHALIARAPSLVAKFVETGGELVKGGRDFTLTRRTTGSVDNRIRLSPTPTVDFQPMRFTWNDIEIEARACATVCPGNAQSKLWVRVGSVHLINPTDVPSLQVKLREWAVCLRQAWLATYNDVCLSVREDLSFSAAYKIDVFMLSSDSSDLLSMIRNFTDKVYAARPDSVDSISMIDGEMRRLANLDLPSQRLKTQIQQAWRSISSLAMR